MEQHERRSGAQKRQDRLRKQGELAYYLTLVKLEGHETWRAHIASDEAGFAREWSNGKHPKVTEKKVLRINRLTAEIDIKE